MTDPSNHILPQIGDRAARNPDGAAVDFVLDGTGAVRKLTWEAIERGAWRARCAFRRRGLGPGDRVVLALETSEHYLAALLGALWAGVVPSTFPPVSGPTTSPAVQAEWRDMLAAFVPALVVGRDLPGGAPALAPEAIETEAAPPLVRDYGDLQEVAYIQFTSGSTGRPRGLALTWAGIRANLEAIARAGPILPEDLVVSWLPTYHDMGLFGSLLTGLHVGCRGVYMDPTLFARNPFLWLRLLESNRASIAVVPPSALQRCIDLMRRRRSRFELPRLTKVLCGSEPVSPRLLDGFREVLAPCGTALAALKPVYGLAEATLAVTFPPHGREPIVDAVDRERFELEGLAAPARPGDPAARHHVSVGSPLPGIRLEIVGADGEPVPDRRVGAIRIESPSLMVGTLEDGRLRPREGRWLETGDLGYAAGGEIFVTGRQKDLIIKYGRNHSPERLEELAGLAEGVRRAAAFGVYDEATLTERIVILAEVRGGMSEEPAARDALRLAIRGIFQDAGYAVDDVELLPKGSLPLTTSGKVRRRRCRQLFLSREAR